MAKKKPSTDFKHRTAKVGRTLTPLAETRIAVRFGSLDVVRGDARAGAEGAARAAVGLREALTHVRHASQVQRRDALLAIRNALSTNPALCLRAGSALVDALGGALRDAEAPLRALAGGLLATALRAAPRSAARAYAPALTAHTAAALATGSGAAALDAAGAVSSLFAAAPYALRTSRAALAPGLVGLLDSAAHTAGATTNTAAGGLPPSYGLKTVVPSGAGSGCVGALPVARATSREARVAITYILRRLLLGVNGDAALGDDAAVSWDSGGRGSGDTTTIATTTSSTNAEDNDEKESIHSDEGDASIASDSENEENDVNMSSSSSSVSTTPVKLC